MIASLVLLAAVSLPDVSAVVGQPKSTPLSGSVLVARTEALANFDSLSGLPGKFGGRLTIGNGSQHEATGQRVAIARIR